MRRQLYNVMMYINILYVTVCLNADLQPSEFDWVKWKLDVNRNTFEESSNGDFL